MEVVILLSLSYKHPLSTRLFAPLTLLSPPPHKSKGPIFFLRVIFGLGLDSTYSFLHLPIGCLCHQCEKWVRPFCLSPPVLIFRCFTGFLGWLCMATAIGEKAPKEGKKEGVSLMLLLDY